MSLDPDTLARTKAIMDAAIDEQFAKLQPYVPVATWALVRAALSAAYSTGARDAAEMMLKLYGRG